MRRILSGLIVFILFVTLLPVGSTSVAAASDYYPKLYDVYFGNDREVSYGDTLTAYARVDNRGYEVSEIRLQMKNTTSMAAFVITMRYDSGAGQWVGQREIDEHSWIDSSWVAEYITVEDSAGHSRTYSQYDRYLIGEFFNWNKLMVDITPPTDSGQVEEKTYKGTVWKNRVVDLTSDLTNNDTLIIENSTINSNGFDLINNGTIILKGDNTLNVKDGWDGYRGYGEVILHGPWFHEVGTEAAAKPRINRVTNDNSDVITGYGEVGAAITIYDTNQNQVYGTGVVGEDMRFSVQLDDKLEGGSFASGLYINMKGQAPAKGYTYAEVWDVFAPSAPELYTVNELTTKVKGSTNESSTIFIKRNYNSKPIAQGYTDDNYKFSIDIPKQEAGSQLIVTAVDFDGNESELKDVTVAPKGDPTELSGTYSHGVIYAEDSPYLINGEVAFASQVQVEPGVEFIAKDSSGPRMKINYMYAVGREDAPITFREVPVTGVKGHFGHVQFENLNRNKNMVYIQIEDLSIYDSRVNNTSFLAATGKVERSLFLNSPLYFSQTLNYIQKGTWFAPGIKNNTFVMDSQQYEQAALDYDPVLKIHGYREVPVYAVKNNNFITPESLPNIISYRNPDGSKLDLTNNYWGTASLDTIKQVKLGGDTNILVEPILQVEAEGTIGYSLPAKPVVEKINNDDRVVNGKAAPGNTVRIIMDETYYYTVQAGADGTFSYQIPRTLIKGSDIQVYQLDQNVIASNYVTVEVIDITSPAAPVVSEVTELSEAVIGTAEALSTIEVRANGSLVGTGYTAKEGSFAVAIPKQKGGTVLEVKATDTSGNVSEKTIVVVKDVTAPVPPEVHEVTDKETNVTGITEPSAVVEVRKSGSVIGSREADKDGKFSVIIPVQKAGQELAVTALDKAGNASEAVIIVVKDVTAPEIPTVFPVSEWDTSIAGEAEPDSFVEVSAAGNVVGTATTDADGYFDISIHQQKAGTRLTFTARDKAGNVSGEATITVIDEPLYVERIAGANRMETAVEIAKRGWQSADTVVIATGDDFPDALAGSPLAYKLDAPILLTNRKGLSDSTKQEITNLGAKRAIILGGTSAVPYLVEEQLKSIGMTKIERLAGFNRFETAGMIADKLGGYPSTAILADGYNYPDALSVASYAAQNGFPILLTKTSVLPSETKSQLAGKTKTIVVGGEAAVSKNVLDSVPGPERIGGANRFETAANITTKLQLSTHKAFIATGRNFADALTGSVLAAKEKAPVLLVEQNSIPDPINNLIVTKNIPAVDILGGSTAVSEFVEKEFKKY
ncbi:MAG: Ig-like domain-containing protein [Bacillota bacterium]